MKKSGVMRLCGHEKSTCNERKRRKNETDQHDEDQQQKKKGLTVGHRPGGLLITNNKLTKYKIAVYKLTLQAFRSNGCGDARAI
jgi:hypothetical protein